MYGTPLKAHISKTKSIDSIHWTPRSKLSTGNVFVQNYCCQTQWYSHIWDTVLPDRKPNWTFWLIRFRHIVFPLNTDLWHGLKRQLDQSSPTTTTTTTLRSIQSQLNVAKPVKKKSFFPPLYCRKHICIVENDPCLDDSTSSK